MRKGEVEGRKGKQPDGSAKTREVKLAVLYSADSRDKNGKPVRDDGSAPTTRLSKAPLPLIWMKLFRISPAELKGRREDGDLIQPNGQVIIGDGAVWIWNIAGELFPDAIQIIDLYHAKGAISKAAKELFGVDNDFGKQWGKERRDDLEAGRIDTILNKLEPFLGKYEEADSCRKYLLKNRERLRYPLFRKIRTKRRCKKKAGMGKKISLSLKREGTAVLLVGRWSTKESAP